MEQKICGRCKTSKNISEFSQLSPESKTYKNFKNGIKPWCKECYREYARKYIKKQRAIPDSKYNHYQSRYGISRDKVIEMLEERDYKCDICGNESDHRYAKLCVDHSHETGKVRGMLCFSCNVMIGQSRDNIEVLSNAIKYLKENN